MLKVIIAFLIFSISSNVLAEENFRKTYFCGNWPEFANMMVRLRHLLEDESRRTEAIYLIVNTQMTAKYYYKLDSSCFEDGSIEVNQEFKDREAYNYALATLKLSRLYIIMNEPNEAQFYFKKACSINIKVSNDCQP